MDQLMPQGQQQQLNITSGEQQSQIDTTIRATPGQNDVFDQRQQVLITQYQFFLNRNDRRGNEILAPQLLLQQRSQPLDEDIQGISFFSVIEYLADYPDSIQNEIQVETPNVNLSQPPEYEIQLQTPSIQSLEHDISALLYSAQVFSGSIPIQNQQINVTQDINKKTQTSTELIIQSGQLQQHIDLETSTKYTSNETYKTETIEFYFRKSLEEELSDIQEKLKEFISENNLKAIFDKLGVLSEKIITINKNLKQVTKLSEYFKSLNTPSHQQFFEKRVKEINNTLDHNVIISKLEESKNKENLQTGVQNYSIKKEMIKSQSIKQLSNSSESISSLCILLQSKSSQNLSKSEKSNSSAKGKFSTQKSSKSYRKHLPSRNQQVRSLKNIMINNCSSPQNSSDYIHSSSDPGQNKIKNQIAQYYNTSSMKLAKDASHHIFDITSCVR